MKIQTILAGSCLAAAFLAGQLWAGTSDVADAAMNKNKAQVRTLIQQTADVNAAQADGTTALMWAVSIDDAEMVDALLAAGADVKIANRDGANPLYVACSNGNAPLVEKLLRAGADPNGAVLVGGELPLMVAARTGNPEAVKSLLDHGAKVNATEPTRGTTALMWAAEQNHPAIIKVLVEKGADVNLTAKIEKPFKQTGLTYAMKLDGKVGGLPAIAYAAREGAIDAVKALLDAKADVNKQTADLSTALLISIQNGHYDVARYLVDHGADPNIANDKGWTPLYLAVKHRTIETGSIPVPHAEQALDFIKVLLERNVNVNARLGFDTEIRNGQRATWLNERGATAFLRAALCGDVEVMKLLLAKGADPNITTNDHTTPLMAAAGIGYSEGFIHDISEETTIDAMRLLLDLGADVNAVNDKGMTALHGAAHKASLAEIQLLVDRGGDLGRKDKGNEAFGAKKDGLLPLNWAEGVPVGVQSAIYHPEAVDLITKLMKEKGVPMPTVVRTVGGNAKANTITRNQK